VTFGQPSKKRVVPKSRGAKSARCSAYRSRLLNASTQHIRTQLEFAKTDGNHPCRDFVPQACHFARVTGGCSRHFKPAASRELTAIPGLTTVNEMSTATLSRGCRRIVVPFAFVAAMAGGVACSSHKPQVMRLETRRVWASIQVGPAEFSRTYRNEIASRVLSEQCRNTSVREVELIVKFYSDDGDFVYRRGEAPLPWLATKTTHTEPVTLRCGRPLPTASTNA
jgi:hypothetical protein